MIEEVTLTQLMNYGVLGLWTLTLMLDKWAFQKKMQKLIEDNTSALTLLNEKLRK
jgi:hypothetical protein